VVVGLLICVAKESDDVRFFYPAHVARASERFSGCRFLVIEEDPTSQPHNLFSGPDQPLAALRSRFFTEESRAARPRP
jgi:hypothetical protein